MEPLPQQQGSGTDAMESNDYDARAEAAIERAKPKSSKDQGSPNGATNEDQPSLPLDPAAPKKDG